MTIKRITYIVEQAVINHNKMISNGRLNPDAVQMWLKLFPEFNNDSASSVEALEALEGLASYCNSLGGHFNYSNELKVANEVIQKAKGE